MALQDLKIAPSLFVGLGGCGSQIVNEIGRKVKQNEEMYSRYKNLLHFFAFDTDMNQLTDCHYVDGRFPMALSRFDKPQFVEHQFGGFGAKENPLFTQWWPEYYRPRDVPGAVGAGQIRIESRLSMYYTLQYSPNFDRSLSDAVRRSIDIHERFRDDGKAILIHIYASLAGGTGSGAFLTMAYILRRYFEAVHRRPVVAGTFLLPNIFAGMGIPRNQMDKIMTNSYAGLVELEHLQGASEKNPIQFHYDPLAKEETHVSRKPFDLIYLVDDVGQRQTAIARARDIYPAVADAAFVLIFSDILQKLESTMDNDEREMGTTDPQLYTKRYGSFGISSLCIPDDDILRYVAHRFAIEAMNRTFALSGKEMAVKGGVAEDKDLADQEFLADVEGKARMPGDQGRFYRDIVEWCDGGGEGGEGAVNQFMRLLMETIEPQIRAKIELPHWTEEQLMDYDEDPEAVRENLPKRLERFKAGVNESKKGVGLLCKAMAKEIDSKAHKFGLADILDGQGPIRERFFYIRLLKVIRARQGQMTEAYKKAKNDLEGQGDKYSDWTKVLEEAAPKTMLEYLRGNDYGKEKVPAFMDWYKGRMGKPTEELIFSDGMLSFLDDLQDLMVDKKDKLAILFNNLLSIRKELEDTAEELRTHGVSRQEGGEASEHVLDVEVYQDHIDPEGQRLWHFLFEVMEDPADYDANKIAAEISRTFVTISRRHVNDAVKGRLVELGREIWERRVRGDEYKEDTGLVLDKSLLHEAELALTWARLRRKVKRPYHGLLKSEEWEAAREQVTDKDMEDYIKDKLGYCATKCAPFWVVSRESLRLPSKRYIAAHPDYLKSKIMDLRKVQEFEIQEGDLVATEDRKKLYFYWAEIGVSLYNIASVDTYASHYEHVRKQEQELGKLFGEDCMYFHSASPANLELYRRWQGQRCPDIPIHTDKNWEGAPDPQVGLFPISMTAVKQNRGKRAWEETHKRKVVERSEREVQRESIREFTMALAFGLIVQREEYTFADKAIKNAEERKLGKFRDVAFARFTETQPHIRQHAREAWESQVEQMIQDRDRAGLDGILCKHLSLLKEMIINVRSEREQAFLEEEERVAKEIQQELLARVG